MPYLPKPKHAHLQVCGTYEESRVRQGRMLPISAADMKINMRGLHMRAHTRHVPALDLAVCLRSPGLCSRIPRKGVAPCSLAGRKRMGTALMIRPAAQINRAQKLNFSACTPTCAVRTLKSTRAPTRSAMHVCVFVFQQAHRQVRIPARAEAHRCCRQQVLAADDIFNISLLLLASKILFNMKF